MLCPAAHPPLFPGRFGAAATTCNKPPRRLWRRHQYCRNSAPLPGPGAGPTVPMLRCLCADIRERSAAQRTSQGAQRAAVNRGDKPASSAAIASRVNLGRVPSLGSRSVRAPFAGGISCSARRIAGLPPALLGRGPQKPRLFSAGARALPRKISAVGRPRRFFISETKKIVCDAIYIRPLLAIENRGCPARSAPDLIPISPIAGAPFARGVLSFAG